MWTTLECYIQQGFIIWKILTCPSSEPAACQLWTVHPYTLDLVKLKNDICNNRVNSFMICTNRLFGIDRFSQEVPYCNSTHFLLPISSSPCLQAGCLLSGILVVVGGVLLSEEGVKAINRTNVLQISCTLHLILQTLLIMRLFLILFKLWVPPPSQSDSSK